MDEVDGMGGNADRGGVAELIQLIKRTKVPIVCICNDRQSQKIRSLANYCFDIRFQRPRVEQIRARLMTIATQEKLRIDPAVLDRIIQVELIFSCRKKIAAKWFFSFLPKILKNVPDKYAILRLHIYRRIAYLSKARQNSVPVETTHNAAIF